MNRLAKLKVVRYSVDFGGLLLATLLIIFWPSRLLPEYHISITFAAVAVSAFVGDLLIHPICRRLKNSAQRTQDNKDEVTFSSSWLGMVERVIYLCSYLLGFVEFIPVWLALKTVSVWRKWGEEKEGRAAFSNYLTGIGLSLLFAIFIALITQKLIEK